MLKLVDIKKDYAVGDNKVHALKGVSLEFRKNEFVSVIGPSGCGKTTLLNIIGGLDKYTSGDLLIGEKSTKQFKDGDWDAYRNNTIGMVFQSYNLISHLSVLDNVSIALTLSGVGLAERKERAIKALEDVGLKDQIHKKPNQLSGGQMQRVAIARSLINNPDILLADEPTGALDTTTSVQIMEILKEISKDRLVIMVTHNEELADSYSDRIIKLVDGLIKSDTKPHSNGANADGTYEKLKNKKTSMSFVTALKHSFKNLMTKKKRTIITSIAGSIGIIGVALVLALSTGMQGFINGMQGDTLAGYPISVTQTIPADTGMGDDDDSTLTKFPSGDTIYAYDSEGTPAHTNIITDNYMTYLNGLDKTLYNSLTYSYGIELNVIAKTDAGGYKTISAAGGGGGSEMHDFFAGGGGAFFSELPDNEEFVKSQYDILSALPNHSGYPTEYNEIALVVDSRNRLDVSLLKEFGIDVTDTYNFNNMLGRTVRIVNNNDFYTNSEGVFVENSITEDLYNKSGNIELKIVGILRVNEAAASELLSSGIHYTSKLTEKMLVAAATSDVVLAQTDNTTTNVLTGKAFSKNITYKSVMLKIGAEKMPTGVKIYPVSFDAKASIKSYLNNYNTGRAESEQILYSDMAESITSMMTTMISTVTAVLTAFAAISLVVSSIMIGIITYVSVVERTKEIGILRAIGARKKDISRLFNAETILIGFAAGLIGVVMTLLLCIPINIIITSFVGAGVTAALIWWQGLALIAISMGLTFIGGLIPSRIAAKKDPVVALRTE